MLNRLSLTVIGLVLATAASPAQTDLDAFMSRVLERRDDNWKKLQQYVLEERESLQITGPGATPLYGSRREYLWFPRDGMFIKSPLRADGVTVSEDDRRKAEADWVKREERREQRRAGRQAAGGDANTTPDGGSPDAAGGISESRVRDALEPGFVSAAYFLRFKFDPGQYALAGREKLEGRDVLRIEYYPTKLFSEGRSRPNREVRNRDEQIEAKMNKVALVTLWIDPAQHQILKYEFRNMELDFLPGRSIVRVDGLNASMEMGEPFPSVWLPRSIRVGFDLTLAVGELDGRYTTDFHDYKLANVDSRVR